MKRKFTRIVAALIIAIFISASFAQGLYAQNAIRKLGRGLANVGTGILELPLNIVDAAKEDGFIAAVTYGIVKGLAMSALRTGIGIYETVTFPIPLPFGYEPMLEPEFLMSEENY